MKRFNVNILILAAYCFGILSFSCGGFYMEEKRPAKRIEVRFKPWGQTHNGFYKVYPVDYVYITDSTEFINKTSEDYYYPESKESYMILSIKDYNDLKCLVKEIYCQNTTCDSIVYCEFIFYYQNFPFEQLAFSTESQVKNFIEKSKHILGEWLYFFEKQIREIDLYKQKKK